MAYHASTAPCPSPFAERAVRATNGQVKRVFFAAFALGFERICQNSTASGNQTHPRLVFQR
ncbi:MAG: hypothetical protein BWY17_02575 [Deltaproteobacteria bacterium ADurb.Bin207]|nr:MAG: hypothetical protein BWY17_02575 [Deltaproteobacteria bacterium ADurb.Bin207]